MVALMELTGYLNDLLRVERFSDYCPNGLQVEGRSEVRRVVGGVTACQPLLDYAAAIGADALLVHHGYFWKGEPAAIVGMKRRRLGTLLGHDMSLLAYHLPLDVHPEFGNNCQLGRVLGLELTGRFGDDRVPDLIAEGRLPHALAARDFARHVAHTLGREPLHVGDPGRVVQRIAWCTGAAQSLIERVVDRGVDAYLTGEASEPTVHVARECGIEFFGAGHHATERFGVRALGAHIAEHFGIEFTYRDVPNPV